MGSLWGLLSEGQLLWDGDSLARSSCACVPIEHPVTHPGIHLCRDSFSFRGQMMFKGNFHYVCQTAVIVLWSIAPWSHLKIMGRNWLHKDVTCQGWPRLRRKKGVTMQWLYCVGEEHHSALCWEEPLLCLIWSLVSTYWSLNGCSAMGSHGRDFR